jgi:hypothetical protein
MLKYLAQQSEHCASSAISRSSLYSVNCCPTSVLVTCTLMQAALMLVITFKPIVCPDPRSLVAYPRRVGCQPYFHPGRTTLARCLAPRASARAWVKNPISLKYDRHWLAIPEPRPARANVDILSVELADVVLQLCRRLSGVANADQRYPALYVEAVMAHVIVNVSLLDLLQSVDAHMSAMSL